MVQRQKVAALPDGTLHDINMTEVSNGDSSKDASRIVESPAKQGEVSNGDSTKDASRTVDSPAKDSGVRLQKTMGLPSACAAIIGTIIGSGIFVSPKGILREVQSVGVSLVIWLGAGLLCSLGGITYAELGTMMPESGGAYVYIKRSFGDFFGFLYMWAISVIIIPAHDAIIAITFAQYIAQPFFPSCDDIPPAVITILGILAITTLTFVNGVSVEWAARVQNIFSVIKIIALICIIGTGIYVMATGSVGNFKDPFEGSTHSIGGVMIAFYSGMFSYSGWDSVNFLVEELKNPYRNLPLAILISVPLVTLIYVLANAAYFSVLSPNEMLASEAVAVTFAMRTFGVMGWIMPLFVAFSTFGSLNGCIMCIGRVFYAGAREGHLPDAIALININNYTPLPAVSVLGILSVLMLFAGDVYTLINYATFVEVLSFFMSAAGLLWLRYKQPNAHRPIKVFILIPILFLLVCLFLLVVTLVTSPRETGMALVILGSGVPVYLIGVVWQNKPRFIREKIGAITVLTQKITMSVPEEMD